jgi:urease accessory protein
VQVTNDIFTKEDGEFLVKHGALPEERIRAVETGGCPHAAIREDISINLGPLEELSSLYKADLLLCESGGGIFLVAFNVGSFITKPVYCPSWCNSEEYSPTRIMLTTECLKHFL